MQRKKHMPFPFSETFKVQMLSKRTPFDVAIFRRTLYADLKVRRSGTNN